MAAYHWEARRRQLQVERRRLEQETRAPEAGRWQDVPQEGKTKDLPPSCSTSPPKPALQDAAERACTCNTSHVPQHSGKLLKRYSTMEYTQQW